MSNVLYNKSTMKMYKNCRFLCFIICVSSILAVGCKNNKFSSFLIKFHIESDIKEIYGSNDGYIVEGVNKDNKRFLGWSTTDSKKNIISTEIDVKNSTVESLFNEDKILDLYAIYADLITVNFMLESTITYTLDSDLKNEENVPDSDKNGFYIKGWSNDNQSEDIILRNDVYTISYSSINRIANGDSVINFYPIYGESNIKLV